MPDHEGTDGNEMADQLTKLVSELQFLGPELACGISTGVAETAVRDWTIIDHRKYGDSLYGLKSVKALIQGPSANRMRKEVRLLTDYHYVIIWDWQIVLGVKDA
jgi:hypothetical protein